MSVKRRRRRALLVAIALMLAAMDAWLGWRRWSGPSYLMQFELSLSLALITDREYATLPIFDVRQKRWLAGNSPVTDLKRFYTPVPVPYRDYHPGLQFKVPDDATVGDFRDAVDDLAGRGYCDIIPFGTLYRGGRVSGTLVISSVRRETGELRNCTLTDEIYPLPTIAVDT